MKYKPKPYGMKVTFTYQQCGKCGSVWVPDGRFNRKCKNCRTNKMIFQMFEAAS